MRVWKIADEDCPICTSMIEFDAGVIQTLGFELIQVRFDEVLDWPRLAGYVKTHLLNDDGTVDIPIYAVEIDQRFTGAVSGENTKGELKRKLLQVSR